MDYGLVMDIKIGVSVTITCFTNADYSNDKDDRKCISGVVLLLDDNVIAYASRKQGINALSTTEAEYVAMTEGVKDFLWAEGLCAELQWEHGSTVITLAQSS